MKFPRLSLRKVFLCLVVVGSLLLVVFNVRSKDWYAENILQPNSIQSLGQHSSSNGLLTNITRQDAQDNGISATNKIVSTINSVGNTPIPPWFIPDRRDNQLVRWPKPAKVSKRTGHRMMKLFPEEDKNSDRIVNQLMYVPPNYDKLNAKHKIIFLYQGYGGWPNAMKDVFAECPVNSCQVSAHSAAFLTADAVLFKDGKIPQRTSRTPYDQVWILYMLESPFHTSLMPSNGQINWTSTYRRDSDIVAPYAKWVYFDDRIQKIKQKQNYAAGKSKQVAWFVSNCFARNNRMQFAQELQNYISVDIYGLCGKLSCSRGRSKECFSLLKKDYKFYLAFENSNCKDYMTEKVSLNGLGHDTIPIVMGARPEDYAKSLPNHSFIHVNEFQSASELADYLRRLDRNDSLYNKYFEWKGTGKFINTYFWCRLCAMLHDDAKVHKNYANLQQWWSGEHICENGESNLKANS